MRLSTSLYVLPMFCASLIWTTATSASEQLFAENCAVCHQLDGTGIPNVYPSLVTSEVVRGSGVDVALVLLIGRGEMPSFKGSLTPEEMASIINFIRSSWANATNEISSAQIEKLQ